MIYDTIGWDVDYDTDTHSWTNPVVDVHDLDPLWVPVIVGRFEELTQYGFKRPLESLSAVLGLSHRPYVLVINDFHPSSHSKLTLADYEALVGKRVGDIIGQFPIKVLILRPGADLVDVQLHV